MEEGSGRRTRPLIPANYVTLRQLQEEKINRKMREEEERKRRKEEEQEVREHKIIKEEEEVKLKKTKRKKKKEEEINRKIENEAVKSEWIGKGVTEDAGEERKPKSKEKSNKRKGRKGANKREEGEEEEPTKGEEKMKEAARGDRFSRLESSRKNRKPDTSEAISSSSSSNLRDRQQRNMQRVGEVTKAIEVLNLGEKGGGAFVDGGMAGERKRLVSGGRGGGRGLGRLGGRDRQLRNMQRVGEVTKAIEVLNLGEKGGGAFVDGGMAGERKRLVSGRRGGGRGLGRRGGEHCMVWVKKSAV